MSDQQSRTASDDLYDRERDEPRSGRRRRPVADWGVGDDMFEHIPRNRFSRAAEGPPRDRRFSRAAEADRHASDETSPRRDDDWQGGPEEGSAWPDDEAAARDDSARTAQDDPSARDDSVRTARDEPRAWTGPDRDSAGEDDPPWRRTAAAPGAVPRGGVDDGRRTIVIGKPEDVPSEIAAITADRDLGDEPEPEPELPAVKERRTVRIGGRPEGSLEAARFHRDHSRRRPARRPHERIGARPDRIAMWAFALGLLLILIAVLSAQ